MTSILLPENIQFDKHIKIRNISAYFSNLLSHDISFICSMFYINGKHTQYYKVWIQLK